MTDQSCFVQASPEKTLKSYFAVWLRTRDLAQNRYKGLYRPFRRLQIFGLNGLWIFPHSKATLWSASTLVSPVLEKASPAQEAM